MRVRPGWPREIEQLVAVFRITHRRFLRVGPHDVSAPEPVKLARGMRVHVRENVEIGLLTFVQEGLYADIVRITIDVKGDGPAYALSVQAARLLRTKAEVVMAHLSPPDHTGPPSHGRASRQLR